MSTTDWWAKKLGNSNPAPPPKRPSPHVNNLPNGIGRDMDSAVGHYMDRNGIANPMGQQQQAIAPVQAEREFEAPDGFIHYRDAARAFKGTVEARMAGEFDTGPCPACGSIRYMSKNNISVTTKNGVVHPNPTCFDCGYPTRQGTLAMPNGIQATVKTVGPVHHSRQGVDPDVQTALTFT